MTNIILTSAQSGTGFAFFDPIIQKLIEIWDNLISIVEGIQELIRNPLLIWESITYIYNQVTGFINSIITNFSGLGLVYSYLLLMVTIGTVFIAIDLVRDIL